MILTIMALSGTLLVATTIAGLLTTYQIRAAGDIAASTRAVYAADAGLEMALYRFFRPEMVATPTTTLANGGVILISCLDTVTAYPTQLDTSCADASTTLIRAVGAHGQANRPFGLELGPTL